jgi:hypothetical protein
MSWAWKEHRPLRPHGCKTRGLGRDLCVPPICAIRATPNFSEQDE